MWLWIETPADNKAINLDHVEMIDFDTQGDGIHLWMVGDSEPYVISAVKAEVRQFLEDRWDYGGVRIERIVIGGAAE